MPARPCAVWEERAGHGRSSGTARQRQRELPGNVARGAKTRKNWGKIKKKKKQRGFSFPHCMTIPSDSKMVAGCGSSLYAAIMAQGCDRCCLCTLEPHRSGPSGDLLGPVGLQRLTKLLDIPLLIQQPLSVFA